jgi:hypothetical protein
MEKLEMIFNIAFDYVNSQHAMDIVCVIILDLVFFAFFKALSGIFSHR